MSNFIHRITNRGLLSELNSLLGLYEEQLLGDKKTIYIDSNQSPYFKNFSFYDIFKTNSIFTNVKEECSDFINEKHAKILARRKTQISELEASNAFIFKDEIYREIQSIIHNLSLPTPFACLHIRRGDKVMEKPYSWSEKTGRAESKRFECSEYLEKVSNINTIFIMTDDYKCIQEAKEHISTNKLKHKLIYLTQGFQDGHSEKLDVEQSKTYTKDELIQFFSEIEIAKLSEIFVGTRSSNVYKYIMNTCATCTKFISLD